VVIPAPTFRLPTRRRRAGRFAIAAGVAATVTAGIIVATLPSSGHSAARPQAIAAQPLTVRELAYRAASAALAGPDVSPGQWVYRKTAVANTQRQSVQEQELWQTADDRHEAWYFHGKLSVYSETFPGQISYSDLRSLPADPVALDRYLIRYEARFGGTPTAARQIAFSEIGELFLQFVLPPSLSAELYHALADFPGVTVDSNAVNSAGVHGIAFALRTGPVRAELILSRTGYAVIGGRAVMQTGGTGQPTRYFTKEWSVLRQSFVSGPGIRP
jgi:hypothetical protein